MTQALATAEQAPIIEQVIVQGDLSKLSPADRVRYYREVCRSMGLNELTRPFEYIVLNGKLTLYARKDCTDQLRGIRGVSITRLERERIDELYAVTAYAADKGGRQDSAIGAVSVKGLGGEALANALMKAETKAKRRVTLSLCGLGWTDETEIDAIPNARTVVVDHQTGEVIEERPARVSAGTRSKMEAKYGELLATARARGLDDIAADLDPEWTDEQLAAAGRTLKELLEPVNA